MTSEVKGDEVFRLSTQPLGDVRLTVVVRRAHDRFTHALICERENESPTEVAQSVDDLSDAIWPPSPPCQQWDRCVLLDDRPGLLAVGMAGVSHWSLSVEVRGAFLFWDVACRLSAHPGWLGSTYDLGAPSSTDAPLELADRAAAQVVRRLGRSSAPHAEPAIVVVEPGSLGKWDDARRADRAVVVPRSLPTRWPATARWQYRWGLLLDERP